MALRGLRKKVNGNFVPKSDIQKEFVVVSYPVAREHVPPVLPNLPAPTAHWSANGAEDPSARTQAVTTTQTRSAPRTPSPMDVDAEPVMFHGRPLTQVRK